MAFPVRRRQYAFAVIGFVALLAAVIVCVWATRTSRRSDAIAVPLEASMIEPSDREPVALIQPEPESSRPSELERSPIPVATESRDGVPLERAVHIAFTVSRPDGSDASDAIIVLAQLATDARGAAPMWNLARGYPGRRGTFAYALPSDSELFALHVFASTGTDTSHVAVLTPPFPERLALHLEPAGHLLVRVSDEIGAPVPDFAVNARAELIDLFSRPRAAASESDPHRVPFSSASTAVDLTNGPRWPLQESRVVSTTDERGVADFGQLRTGTWRVQVGSDPEPAAQFSEALIVSGDTTELELRLDRKTYGLAVEGWILDEHGQPLPRRTLFVRTGDDEPRSIVVSDATGLFREFALSESVSVEPRLEHPSEQFDPPIWEGPRGTRGVVFQRRTAGEWVDATLRVVERSTRAPVSTVELEYEIALSFGKYGASRNFDGELHAALPVAEGMLMNVSAPGFGRFAFQSAELREHAAKGGVFVIELDRQAAPILKRD